MAYIGKSPTIGNFQKCDAITVVNGQAAYTMQVGGTNVSPESENHMLVSLNGILQAPVDSFTISGSTITFASNLATGDVIDFIMLLGNVLDLGVPSDNTVTAAKLNNDIISGQTALTSEPADTDEFLVSDAGTLKRIDYSLIKGGGITMADQWRVTSAFSGNATPIANNWERNDTAPSLSYFGSQMSESSGIFTFPSTGIYEIHLGVQFKLDGDSRYNSAYIKGTTDNSNYVSLTESNSFISNFSSGDIYGGIFASSLVDITNTSTHKVRFDIDLQNTGVEMSANTVRDTLYARFIRLGDT